MALIRATASRPGRIRRRATVEALEPRILLSADLPVALPVAAALPPDGAALAEPLAAAAADLATPAQHDDRRELVIVDAGVEGLEALLVDLRDAGGVLDVVLLDRDCDGVAQIGEALAAYHGELDAVHVLSHGTDAGIQLGDAWLTRDTLAARAQDVAGWGDALTAEGDLLLYGCDLAGSADGRALVEGLAVLTGADVAASDDLTGSALLGGDWELEYRTGALETRVALGADAAASWSGVLGQIVHTSYESVDNQSEIKSDAQWGQSFRHTSGDGTYTVNEVALRLHRESDAVPQSITVSLRTSWNGPVLGSATISSTTLGTAQAWHTFDLGSVELNDGQSYVLRIATNTTQGKVHLGFDASSSYADGDRIDTNGSPLGGEDVAFRVSETTGTILDRFDAVAWNGNDGTRPWSGDWQELGESTDPSSGDVRVAAGAFRMGGNETDISGHGVAREANLSGATWATLSFDWRRQELDEVGGTVHLEVSGDGGASWTLLRTYDLNGTTSFATDTFDISAWIAPNTQIRFIGQGLASSLFFADDVQIEHDLNGPAVNQAPVLVPSAPALPTISEDDLANPGNLISAVLGSSVSDLNLGALEGIAVTGLASGNGTWEYSTDGGTTWSAVGPVSNTSALLLRASDRIRFVPDGQNADAASFTFRAWDQTTGAAGAKVNVSANGGITAFSAATDTASIAVTAVNDAPVLTPGSPVLPAIDISQTNNAGALVSDLLGSSVSDVDAGAVEGIAVTNLGGLLGSWEYSTDGGVTWNATGTVSDANALLLRATDRIRFVPSGVLPGVGQMTYRAWDQTSGAAGAKADASVNGGTTAFSGSTDTAAVTVATVNFAPTLTPSAPALPTISEDDLANPGNLISAVLGSSVSDLNLGALEGIAVTGLASGNGTWEYSTDGGTTWSAVGPVSNTSALLLRASDRIRFVPDGQNADAASFTFRAWDQTTGAAGAKVNVSANGGITAFSAATDTASIAVTAVNDAPVLTPAGPTLPGISEDDTANPGELVSAILGATVSDVDVGAVQGIAVTGLASGNGTWELSSDGGATWSTVGPVSDTSALLLRASDRIRFVPDGQNADAASFTFRAWDQTTGAAGAKVDASATGGITCLSTATDTASIAVTGVNDAPSLGNASLAAVAGDTVNPPGAPLSTLFAGGFADVDAGAFFAGVAVVRNLADATAEGIWQYSSDGGASWSAIGSVSDGPGALALDANTLVRFVPASGASGAPNALVVRGLDDTYVGGFSSTGGGEVRVHVDTGSNGGTTAVAGTSTVSTTVTAAPDDSLPPDLELPDDTAPDVPPPRADGDDAPGAEPNPEEPPIVGAPTPDGGSEGPDALPSPDAPGIPEMGRSTAPVPGAPPVMEDATQREHDPEPAAAAAQRGMEMLRALLSRMAGTELSDLVFLNGDAGFLAELDELRDEAEAAVQLETKLIGSTLAISTGLSVGYVIWLTRGGLLLASLLSSMPAWRLIDPVPILARLRNEDDEEDRKDEESLDSLIRGESPPGRSDSVERAPPSPEV